MSKVNSTMEFHVVGFEHGNSADVYMSLNQILYEENDFEIMHTIRENIDDYLGMSVGQQMYIHLTRNNHHNSLGVIQRIK